MQRSRFDLWIGLFIVLGTIALAVLALKAANLLTLNWDKKYSITATFDDLGGLKQGASVRSAGIVVGKVDAVSLNAQSYQAEVKLSLFENYQFPADSSIKIMTSGLLGEQYLAISPGYEDDFWLTGAQVTNTQSAVVLENLISQFMYQKTTEAAD